MVYIYFSIVKSIYFIYILYRKPPLKRYIATGRDFRLMTGGREKRQLEREVEGYLVRQVEKMGGMCPKFDSVRGWPDRIVLLPSGVLAWVETKRPVGGVLSPAQLVIHEQLRRVGQKVYVVWSQDAVDVLLESLASLPAEGRGKAGQPE